MVTELESIWFNWSLLQFQKFYRYHEMLQEKNAEQNRLTKKETKSRPPYWKIFKQAGPQLFNIFFIFFVTLSVFPTVHSDIKRNSDDFIIPAQFFVTITCFLTFNFFAMLGSLATSWCTWVSCCGRSWGKIESLIENLFLFLCSRNRNTSCTSLWSESCLFPCSCSAGTTRRTLTAWCRCTLTVTGRIGLSQLQCPSHLVIWGEKLILLMAHPVE